MATTAAVRPQSAAPSDHRDRRAQNGQQDTGSLRAAHASNAEALSQAVENCTVLRLQNLFGDASDEHEQACVLATVRLLQAYSTDSLIERLDASSYGELGAALQEGGGDIATRLVVTMRTLADNIDSRRIPESAWSAVDTYLGGHSRDVFPEDTAAHSLHTFLAAGHAYFGSRQAITQLPPTDEVTKRPSTGTGARTTERGHRGRASVGAARVRAAESENNPPAGGTGRFRVDEGRLSSLHARPSQPITSARLRAMIGTRGVSTQPWRWGEHKQSGREGQANAQTLEEWRQKLDETKKEIRELRAQESAMKWEMDREEKRAKQEEEVERDREIMNWRVKERTEMTKFVKESFRERQKRELDERKEYVEFLRWAKQLHSENLKKVWSEMYAFDKQFALWQDELGKQYIQTRKDIIERHKQHWDEQRENKRFEAMREKMMREEEAQWRMELEMEHKYLELIKQREQMKQKVNAIRDKRHAPLRKPK
ncbi:unnamed protein product [Vitrella brassicaformis CCMP3155]|uniref:Uncharacterized protein n=2 Tax=Vitrella brassicaformis TaxID=1169539 RepID=A0A0G4FFU0_VITBC|nr:unnamed protein product [Vitrella brassicaformis CCMP3155]|mmetsp:Transcript_29556/g.73598  ORF Transcript_29556/g.73598 Transcript_29556/m.73598 type:complete len:484 (+) Transcript_29556:213-1664(+)|eukprot:CEM11918.1 unnamed protein product [Vitrella brassicaformis CCMP3155]